jgi:ABC-2 type transport system permease protein
MIMGSLLRADLAVVIKNRRALMVSIVMPVLVLFATNSGKATRSFGGSLFIIGLALSYGLVANSIMGYALAVARDREQGVFQRLRVTPAPAWTIMVSRLTMQALSNLAITVVVLIVGTRIHHISLSAGTSGLVLVVSILGSAIFLSIGQALVGLVKSSDSINAVGRLLMIGLILLSSLGQSGALGATWDAVARWSPVGVVMKLFASVFNLSAWNTNDSLTLLTGAGYIVIFAAIGIRWFQWDAR